MSVNDGTDALNIVFIALSVSGQLNVHLATIEHMLTLGSTEAPPLHIHLLSFDPAEKRALALAKSFGSGRNSLTFHSLGELLLFTEICDNGLIDRHGPATLMHRNGLKSYRFLAELFGFNPEKYVGVYERILEVFSSIKPRVHIAAVDLTMPIGMDACTTANVPWGILCPNSGLELSKHDQPFLRGFWKFPAYVTVPFHFARLKVTDAQTDHTLVFLSQYLSISFLTMLLSTSLFGEHSRLTLASRHSKVEGQRQASRVIF